ncbi:hypothetical protein EW146_g5114 [Bondarzewia mesenterica]|uniref:Uncharacterized protein n=1 Tax=Bondarzewia mesenterica TaxID=1095465 RepID=A0A4S4LT13_9AGAM|nr:hypothetical protein EW146_g5114 [Bondarzewia mesenterica]
MDSLTEAEKQELQKGASDESDGEEQEDTANDNDNDAKKRRSVNTIEKPKDLISGEVQVRELASLTRVERGQGQGQEDDSHAMVLRNLTQCEDALIEWPRTSRKEWRLDRVTFGEVLVARTCRSTDPDISMFYDGNIRQGVWAGHRFDRVCANELELQVKDTNTDGEWTVVRLEDEVMKEVAAIWKS